MIHAYPEMYLSKAQSVLGDAFDYAINICNIPGDTFMDYFASSSFARRMENGESAIILGKSGPELLIDVVCEITGEEICIEIKPLFNRSREYWIGWALAYYQWFSSKRFIEIFMAFNFDELAFFYETFHETDIRRFVDMAEEKMGEKYSATNLKRIRVYNGLTQAELAEKSNVSLRSIQMYEQKNKDINKAGAESVYRLSRTLGCSVESLLETSGKR